MPKKSRIKKQTTKKVKKPETKNQEASLVSKLEELFIEIFAHDDLDRKVYICGRGTNPFEAANVVYGMLNIIYGGDDNEWRRDNQKRIDDYKAEWRKVREENVED